MTRLIRIARRDLAKKRDPIGIGKHGPHYHLVGKPHHQPEYRISIRHDPDVLDVAFAMSGICSPFGLYTHTLPAIALETAVVGGIVAASCA